MAMCSRERNFAEAAIQDIQSNLRCENEPYCELSRFWAVDRYLFDYADPTEEIWQLEEYMSELRRWMSYGAPQKFNIIEKNVRQLEADYTVRCDEIMGDLSAYGRVVDTLTEAIGSPDFATSFNKAELWVKISVDAPVLYEQRAERRTFLDNIQKQFGFDYITASIMWKVYNYYQYYLYFETEQQTGWRFMRSMSMFCYNIGRYQEEQWQAGAGYLYDYTIEDEERYFIDVLKLTDNEYNRLRGMIRLQNMMVSDPERYNPSTLRDLTPTDKAIYIANMEKTLSITINTDDEYYALYNKYWGDFLDKGDYAHMAYTISAHLVDENRPGVKESFKVNALVKTFSLWEDHDTRRDVAGWMGDATIPTGEPIKVLLGIEKPSFGSDDYIADLDAVNIAHRVNMDTTIIQAMNDYYSNLDKNEAIRIEEFINCVPYEKIEDVVLTEANVKTVDALKEKWPDSYNFLINLQNGNSTMYNYID